MLLTQRRGVIPTPEVYSYTVKNGKKAQRIAACACAVAAHAAIIVGAFTAIEFMCVVFGTNIVENVGLFSIRRPIFLG